METEILKNYTERAMFDHGERKERISPIVKRSHHDWKHILSDLPNGNGPNNY
jgi:hypothetical protein